MSYIVIIFVVGLLILIHKGTSYRLAWILA